MNSNLTFEEKAKQLYMDIDNAELHVFIGQLLDRIEILEEDLSNMEEEYSRSAFDSGYDEGHSDGYAEGQDDAYGDAYDSGYEAGYEAAKEELKDE